MKARACLALAALVLALPVTSLTGPSRQETDAVLEATLRGAVKQLVTADARALGTVACLQVDPGGAPQSVSKEFLLRFKELPFARRGAECEARARGAVERSSAAPALIITAGPIQWVAPDEAHVRVTYFGSATDSATRVYRVVKDTSGWILLGQIIMMSPA
jgi:hypothetical protein